ncbi:MAG: acyl transferase [Bacteroidota bacterium]
MIKIPAREYLLEHIFNLDNQDDFRKLAIQVFQYQYQNNPIYKRFADCLVPDYTKVQQLEDIPFLPIEFFKWQKVYTGQFYPKIIFTSSGTTGMQPSRHFVRDLSLYEKSFLKGFHLFLGDISQYAILALLPSYLEREHSSLIYMVEKLIKYSAHPHSGFYLYDYNRLREKIESLIHAKQKILLIGVTFALLEMAEKHYVDAPNMIVMETGGMKGRRKEMIRQELHHLLRQGFGVQKIYSEYGMTELLSQAYSLGNGIFQTPPWLNILMRDMNDPKNYVPDEKTGAISVIDLANIDSCAFIATQDLGKKYTDGSFEVLGRYDNSDVRGCNLMVE